MSGPQDNRISELERQIAALKARFPAHSIPPALMAELDELETALKEAQRSLTDPPAGKDLP